MPNTGYSLADRAVPARLAAAVAMKANTALSVVLAGCARIACTWRAGYAGR